MEVHPYARRLTTDEYRLVEDLTRKNVEGEYLAILKEQNKDNVSTIKDIYNTQSKIRKAQKVGETTRQNLMSLLHTQGYVHDYDTHPVTNELEALFFVHPSSFKIWHAFPHVLIMDATYKTNIYKMPFVEIVGITSTSKTFCIAFAFISEEKEKNYEWVLERLKLTLEGCMLPRVIITDRELALIGEYIPLDSVDIFWRTLNVSWSEPVEDDDIHVKMSDEIGGFRASLLTDLGLSEDQLPLKVAGRDGKCQTHAWLLLRQPRKVVINLSDAGGCNTSFPLWSRPSQSDITLTDSICPCEGRPLNRVALREGFPL
ncbi:FAR1-related sequence 5-like protein [Tanacetum coccineum]